MQQEQVLFSLPLSRLEPIFKQWLVDVLERQDMGRKPLDSEVTSSTPMTIKQAAEFLGIKQQTIYQNIHKIPHAKRFGKLYFLQSELETYLIEGKIR